MSDLGGYPPSPPAPAPPPGAGSSSEIPLWVVGVAGFVVLAMVGALAFAVFGTGGSSAPPAAAAPSHSSTPHPAHSDHRIAAEVAIAEKDRGLRFKHPVPVHFLAPAAFRRTLVRDNKVTARDRRQVTQEAGLLRAFGLLSGQVDLLTAVDDFSGSAVLAYYSFKDQDIVVRGRVITPAVKATLVHELTHVLQDEYFDVGARVKAIARAHARSNHDEGSVLHAIIEGDAQRVEHSYGSSLDPAARRALVAAQNREASQAQQGLATVPAIIVALESSPYDLGEGLVRAVAEHGGKRAVAHLFQHPPKYDVALFDPFRVLEGQAGSAHVSVPPLRPGETRFDRSDFGALTWYLMLSARLPALEAMHAVDGWDGDAFVGYRSHGLSCARAHFVGRTAADTEAMHVALERWIAAAPGSTATVSLSGGLVTFDSCDPGTRTQTVNDLHAAIDLLTARTLVGITLLHAGAPVTAARCIAGRLVDTYTVAQLDDPTFGANDPTIQTNVQRIAAACR